MFTILDQSNTARLSLNDPRPNAWHSRAVDTLADVRAIAQTIEAYARERHIPARMVQVSIAWPSP